MSRATLALLIGLALSVSSLVFGVVRWFSIDRNYAASFVTAGEVSEQDLGLFFVPYPTYHGVPLGDCSANGKYIAYSMEKTCYEVLEGDSWTSTVPR